MAGCIVEGCKDSVVIVAENGDGIFRACRRHGTEKGTRAELDAAAEAWAAHLERVELVRAKEAAERDDDR